MKPNKFGTLAVAAVIALGAYSAKAADVTVNHSTLNVSISVTTNGPEITIAGIAHSWKDPLVTTKIGNKQLLDLFAHWNISDRSVEPWKSAKLVVGWDWSDDVLVVDKTGTNVLFDADYAPDAYFIVDFFDEYGVGNDGGVDFNPGHYAGTDTDSADFTLYDDNYYLDYTDISGYGGNKQTFNQSWDSNGNYTTWTDSESATFPYAGDQTLNGWGPDATTTATIKASGSGKGFNEVGWAD
jgi:hypothetical protein